MCPSGLFPVQREPYLSLSLWLEKRERLAAIVVVATCDLLYVKNREFELPGSQNSSVTVMSGQAHIAGKDPLDSLNVVPCACGYIIESLKLIKLCLNLLNLFPNTSCWDAVSASCSLVRNLQLSNLHFLSVYTRLSSC